MSKAILVLGNMPTNCDDCWLCNQTCDGAICGTPPSWGIRLPDSYSEVRPAWCPLRELPDKAYAGDDYDYYDNPTEYDQRQAYCDGWNDYLKKVGGDTDG